MIKIGMIGSDSSHAAAFSKLLNSDGPEFSGVSVTHIWGDREEESRSAAQKGGILELSGSAEELISQVDAAMVLFRRGERHAEYVKMCVEAGIPVYVDKPFTDTEKNAQELVSCAKKAGVMLLGGSTCRYVPAVAKLRERRETCRPSLVVMNFPADWDSPLGGLDFYGSHLVEMCLAAFGCDYHNVSAARGEGVVTAVVSYPDFPVVLNFVRDCPRGFAVMSYSGGSYDISLDISNCYPLGMSAFVSALKGEASPPDSTFFPASVNLMRKITETCQKL